MPRDINNPILWHQAIEIFMHDVLPVIQREYEQDGEPDIPARCEAWNNWTDSLCKGGIISDWQYANWSHPPCND
jgi:hypothetical protein